MDVMSLGTVLEREKIISQNEIIFVSNVAKYALSAQNALYL